MKNFNYLKFLFVILVSMISENKSTVPPYINLCSRSSPQLADCVRNAILLLRRDIAAGGFPNYVVFEEKLVPLHVGDVTINRSFYLHLQNVNMLGIQNFNIDKLRINLDNFKIEALLTIPKIDGSCKYNLRWMLTIFNLEGNGNGDYQMENVKVLLKLSGSKYIRNGAEYLKIDNTEVKIKSAKIRVYFHNLFKGSKNLEVAANEVINQNVDQLTGDIYPVMEQVIARKLQKIANQVFAKDSFNDFFLQ